MFVIARMNEKFPVLSLLLHFVYGAIDLIRVIEPEFAWYAAHFTFDTW